MLLSSFIGEYSPFFSLYMGISGTLKLEGLLLLVVTITFELIGEPFLQYSYYLFSCGSLGTDSKLERNTVER